MAIGSGRRSCPLSGVVSAGSEEALSSEISNVDPVIPVMGIGVSSSVELFFSEISDSGVDSIARDAAGGSVGASSVSKSTAPTWAEESEEEKL